MFSDVVPRLRRNVTLLVLAMLTVGIAALSLNRADSAIAVMSHSVSLNGMRSAKIAASEAQPRTWGVANDELPWNPDAMSDLSAVTRHRAGVVMWYVAWSLNSSFSAVDATRVASWGAIPEITWEPWDPGAGVDQPQYSLANITAGRFDTYLRSWATAVKAWGHPIRIRFAHEMNGNWYPWAQGVNGNGAGSYVAAWRHVVSLFRAVGASNVTWVWSPNVPYPGSTAMAHVFPGDTWVGRVAVDGYNWGTMQGGHWTSFSKVFSSGVTQLSELSTHPIDIGEVGCPETGGAKPAWVRAMWTTLGHWPRVRSLTWFDFDKEADWRINSSPSSAAAFRAGLSGFTHPRS